MILLDTNVVSAVMAPSPPRSVLAWLNGMATTDLHVSTITIAEVAFGLHSLPAGRRRQALADRFEEFIARGFHQRVLVFDEPSARRYGIIMAHRRAMGRPMSVPDGQIAAIAHSRRLVLATRNTRDFAECGLDLLDPFELRE